MATMQLSRDSHDSRKDDYVNQDQKVNELRSAIGPVSGRGLKYCTDACLRRYLEARNWNIDKSKKMLEETLRWRSTYRPEEIRWHEVAQEGETGKAYRATFHDHQGRTVLVLRPGKQNTSSHDNRLRHLVYLIENAILNVPEDQEQMVWLIDFTGWSLNKAVPIKTARETANILQSHYPERLHAAFLYNPPRIFETFWKACAKVVPANARYGMDPSTDGAEKVRIIRSLCGPLSDVLMGSPECLASDAALCLKALVESDNWRFASDEVVNEVCLKVAGALEEKATQTNAHMGLVMALSKHNNLIVEAYARSLLRSGLKILTSGAAETNSQRRFSAIQMVNFLMKCVDSRSIASEIDAVLQVMDNCHADKMPFVRGAAYEARTADREAGGIITKSIKT